MKASYTILDSDQKQFFTLTETKTQKPYKVKRVVIPFEKKAYLEGLPQELEKYMGNFTEEDIFISPINVLNVLITINDTRGGAIRLPELPQSLPNDDVLQQTMFDLSFVKNKPPSSDYEMIGQIGKGGFGDVFKVMRRKDDHYFALKAVKASVTFDQDAKHSVLAEIYALRKCKTNFGVTQIIDVYEWKNRLYIV